MSHEESAPAESTIRSRARETVRTARYALVGCEPEQASRVWFVLHGYGQLATRFLRPFEGVVEADTCVVAPEGLSRFYLESPRADGSHMQRIGASWLTREERDDEIRDAMRWLDLVHHDVVSTSCRARGIAPAVGVLGFSQGVATMMRWIATGDVTPSQVVLWAGGLAHDVDADVLLRKLARADVTLVAGAHDQFATADARTRVLQQARAVHPAVREVVFEGSHHLDTTVLRSLLQELHAPSLPA